MKKVYRKGLNGLFKYLNFENVDLNRNDIENVIDGGIQTLKRLITVALFSIAGLGLLLLLIFPAVLVFSLSAAFLGF